jgi:hypothetical protein
MLAGSSRSTQLPPGALPLLVYMLLLLLLLMRPQLLCVCAARLAAGKIGACEAAAVHVLQRLCRLLLVLLLMSCHPVGLSCRTLLCARCAPRICCNINSCCGHSCDVCCSCPFWLCWLWSAVEGMTDLLLLLLPQRSLPFQAVAGSVGCSTPAKTCWVI